MKRITREHTVPCAKRYEVLSCPYITPATIIGDWMLRRGPLERRGFHVLEETRVSPASVI